MVAKRTPRKPIQDAFNKVINHLHKVERDYNEGWYFIEIAVPSNWVYKSNESVVCEKIHESDVAHKVRLTPRSRDFIIDEMFDFIGVIIETNEKITKKEEKFKQRIENLKAKLEEEAKSFYENLNNLREDSFKVFEKNDNDDESNDNTENESQEKVENEK